MSQAFADPALIPSIRAVAAGERYVHPSLGAALAAPASAQDNAGSGDAAGQTPTTPADSPTANGAVQAETGTAAATPDDSDVNRGEIIITATRRASCSPCCAISTPGACA